MSLITVDDIANDPLIRQTLDAGLADAISSTSSTAHSDGTDRIVKRDGYRLSIDLKGNIDVHIEGPGGLARWTEEGGELATLIGPKHDVFIDPPSSNPIDADADDSVGPSWFPTSPPLHWAGWSRRFAPNAEGEMLDLTVDVGTVTWAWRCDSCGAASADAEDFNATTYPAMGTCDCGGTPSKTPAVYCESCDTLILLRSAEPN